jgi:hypothetical protein
MYDFTAVFDDESLENYKFRFPVLANKYAKKFRIQYDEFNFSLSNNLKERKYLK